MVTYPWPQDWKEAGRDDEQSGLATLYLCLARRPQQDRASTLL